MADKSILSHDELAADIRAGLLEAEALEDHAARLKALEDAREDHETRLRGAERLIQWFLGAAATAGFLIGVFADSIKKKLGLA